MCANYRRSKPAPQHVTGGALQRSVSAPRQLPEYIYRAMRGDEGDWYGMAGLEKLAKVIVAGPLGYRYEGLRFSDDPLTAAKPIEHPLIADFNHQELRTRHPISFQGVELPSIVNPLEFRVVYPPSGAQGQWVALQRAVLLVPELTDLTCADAPDQYWIHGHHLDKIDAIDSQTAISTVPPPSDSTASNTTSADTDNTAVPLAPLPIQPAQLDACDNGGLCLKVVSAQRQPTWRIPLRWVDQRVFHVKLGELPACRP